MGTGCRVMASHVNLLANLENGRIRGTLGVRRERGIENYITTQVGTLVLTSTIGMMSSRQTWRGMDKSTLFVFRDAGLDHTMSLERLILLGQEFLTTDRAAPSLVTFIAITMARPVMKMLNRDTGRDH